MKQRLVWLIGKPGSGKTTVGKNLEQSDKDICYYSFSDLLKTFQPNLGQEGFDQATREKVYLFIAKECENKTIIISGNPYTASSYQEMAKIVKNFLVINFQISDQTALERLTTRGRDIFIHDGVTQEERLNYFNKNVLPEIEKISKEVIYSIETNNKTTEEVCSMVRNILHEAEPLTALEEAEEDVASGRLHRGDLNVLLTKIK